jgi:dihydropteroate synthase
VTDPSTSGRAAAVLPHVEGRPVVMGVVNVTPDSFSDGGEWFEPQAAVDHGRLLMAQGADIIDVGGESTRPGAERPSVQEELRRVLPLIEVIAAEGATVSVDTMRAVVASRALAAGASIVNDVSGGLADPDMVRVVAQAGVPFVAMHWRGHSVEMQGRAVYDDVVAEVCAQLAARRDALLAAGIAPGGLVLDPGLGFAKLAEHNWSILARLDVLQQLGHPVLVGASRKSFLGRLGVPEGGVPRPPAERDAATAATSVIASLAGVWGVRVHDVPATRDALAVVSAVREHS